MSAVLVQVAEAVAALLNTAPANTFNQKFTARRSYPTWKVPLTQQSELLVDVVPTSITRCERGTRESTVWGCRLVIVLRKKFGDAERKPETTEGRPLKNDPVDSLVLLVEQICTLIYGDEEDDGGMRLQNSSNFDAVVDQEEDGAKPLATYREEHLSENNQFTAAIQVTYRVSKQDA